MKKFTKGRWKRLMGIVKPLAAFQLEIAWADTFTLSSQQGAFTVTCVNRLYADVLGESDLVQPEISPQVPVYYALASDCYTKL